MLLDGGKKTLRRSAKHLLFEDITLVRLELASQVLAVQCCAMHP